MPDWVRIERDEANAIRLDILKRLKLFCQEKGIPYFLSAGTAIGAVRHQGFIPWDDDIDVYIPRRDYRVFLAEFNKVNPLYQVYAIEINSWYVFPFAKISYVESLIVEACSLRNQRLGINIDVFPIDSAPNDSVARQAMLARLAKYKRILNVKLAVVKYPPRTWQSIRILIAKVLFYIHSCQYYGKKISDLAQSFPNEEAEYMGNLVWMDAKKRLVPAAVFAGHVDAVFEDEVYPLAKGFDQLLTSVYGDYMQLPPVEKRRSHHTNICYRKAAGESGKAMDR